MLCEQIELVTLERAESLKGKLKTKINLWPFKNKKDKELKLVDEGELKDIIDQLDLEQMQKDFIKAINHGEMEQKQREEAHLFFNVHLAINSSFVSPRERPQLWRQTFYGAIRDH